jgi:hypothetical protein
VGERNCTVHGNTRSASIVNNDVSRLLYLLEEVVRHRVISGRHLCRRGITRPRSKRRAARAQLAEAPGREPADQRTIPFLYNSVINAATKQRNIMVSDNRHTKRNYVWRRRVYHRRTLNPPLSLTVRLPTPCSAAFPFSSYPSSLPSCSSSHFPPSRAHTRMRAHRHAHKVTAPQRH